MAEDYYQTLGINQQAGLAEIKQAYRKLAKEFHPDCNQSIDNCEQIIAINRAYEVLSNPQSRASYDSSMGIAPRRVPRPSVIKRERATDALTHWLDRVSDPIFRLLDVMIDPLQQQIEWLSADPFDEELLEVFTAYIDQCRQTHQQAQTLLRTLPNPSPAATVASHLFHCLNALGDGIEELSYFTMNFDDRHLHTAQELWRRAEEMRSYARFAVTNLQRG
jgi:molecular chaperone DnaJ